eukprot:344535_1
MAASLDMDVFKLITNACFGKDTKHISIPKCDALNRFICALKYFTLLNLSNNPDSNNLFTEFCDDVYPNLLDDRIHIIRTHSSQLQQIHKALIEHQNIGKCTLSKCNLFQRHYAENRRPIANKNKLYDSKFLFYRDIFDGMHHYLFHLFDIGMRIEMNEEKKQIEEDDYQCIDHEFSKKKGIINEKKNKLQFQVNRFNDDSNKFNIKTTETNSNDQDILLFDAMFEHLNEKHLHGADELYSFIKQEEYESDSIMDDFQDDSIYIKSNIIHHISNKEIGMAAQQYVQAIALSGSSFSTGFCWFYWEHYRNIKKLPHGTWNINDFGGYDICDLFIEKKYSDYKTELLQHINISDYNDIVLVKAETYMVSETIKELKPCDMVMTLEYGIKENDVISMNHVVSVIMYCDFSNYCTSFSASFRTVKKFETLDSVKNRNREFWWQSKLLRETSEIYGMAGTHHGMYTKENYIRGPFYCGMSIKMIMPEFGMRLYSPTSTSTEIEVSMNFAKRKGIIIQLNNDGHGDSTSLVLFDCSWVSRFAEESEIFFFGGWEKITIESVRIVETHQNFKRFFKALFVFDGILNGSDMRSMKISRQGTGRPPKITAKDVTIVSKLIQIQLEPQSVDLSSSFDEYILSTFKLFVQKKIQVTCNMFYYDVYYKRTIWKDMCDLLLQSEIKQIKWKDNDDIFNKKKSLKSNLISAVIFLLFKNVKNVLIRTSSAYVFDLFHFLDILTVSIKSDVQITIEGNNDGWISKLWSLKKLEIENEYKKHNFKLSYFASLKEGWRKFDRLVICKDA